MNTNVEGPRPCRPDELAQVIGLVDAAMRQGSDQTLLTDYPLVYAPDNLPNVHVVAVDGRLVATAPVLPRRIRGPGYEYMAGIISPTATDPDYQHRGFGTACVRACIARMEEAGAAISVLWTQVATFPFYELNGYQAVRADLELVSVAGTDALRFRDGGERMTNLDVEDAAALGAVRALHEADGPGVARRPQDWPRLLSLPKMRTRLALREGVVVAYLVDSRATNKPGFVEGGGDPAALETLVHRALRDRQPGERVPIALMRMSHVLRRVVLQRLGDDAHPGPGGHTMVRINDPAALWRALGRAGTPPAVDRRTLASIVFGPHPERPVDVPAGIASDLAAAFPIELPIPPLDHS